MIKAVNLTKSYKQKIVLNINELTVNDGEIFGLVGNNGAGKTTLLRLMLDLIKADKGELRSGEHVISKSEKWKDYTSSYLDEGFLIDFLTPEEYFDFIAEEYGSTRELIASKLSEFSNFFNGEILGQKRKFIRDFSKGNKQKMGIASALITGPKVLILDEPFNSLDPTSQIILKQMLSDYNRKSGALIVISSHDLNHLTEICTRIAIIEKGLIIRDLRNDGRALAELADYFSVRKFN
ncbi:MAG: ABC transporter ATP-binding protein [Bacteroidales bacterium]|nr:ABC transporter ATP-binding protein [Bacteroidales bacterium]